MSHCTLILGNHKVIVDRDDLFVLSHHRWSVFCPDGKKPYAVSRVRIGPNKYRTTYMHRLLVGAPRGMEVDHINGNGLDNRKCNLRLATRQQNCRNTGKRVPGSSRFVGVSWDKRHDRWAAYIWVNKHKKGLGYHEREVDAAKAYDAAAREHFGEFARLNLPESENAS